MPLDTVLIPIALQIILITVFNVDPALAGVVSSSQVSANAKAADATQLSPSAEPKWQIILKRVFYGANAKLNFRKWRAGDTRGDNLMLLLNAVSMCALMGGLLFVATIIGQREAAKEMWHMKKEVLREKKYREVGTTHTWQIPPVLCVYKEYKWAYAKCR
ncbi:hypothetical protein EON64_00490 [archaeon]|nr:MAG: hypothetical protein EON64_00490 [archaeon]